MQGIALFEAIGAKMDYLGQRQRVISQNIANADTPNYTPEDLAEVDFGVLVRSIDGKTGKMLAPMQTNANHINKFAMVDGNGKEIRDRDTYERSPAGNEVIVEEQLLKSNQTVMEYTLMTNLYRKQTGLFRIAMGN